MSKELTKEETQMELTSEQACQMLHCIKFEDTNSMIDTVNIVSELIYESAQKQKRIDELESENEALKKALELYEPKDYKELKQSLQTATEALE